MTVKELMERLQIFEDSLEVTVEDAILGEADLLDVCQEKDKVIFVIV